METNPDVLIIGGGLAGLSAGIHLSKKGISVTLIEKSSYPKHKVCGEYISNEIVPYLKWLGVDVSQLNPVSINKFEFSSITGTPVTANLPLGGFGVSRYALDDFLYKKAIANGCNVIHETVSGVTYNRDAFTVTAGDSTYTAKVVLGAHGKRSAIDQQMSRSFMGSKSPWLAVKSHYKGDFPDDVVALHNFPGGYCGVSKVENNSINICYLADYKTFKKYKNIEEYQREVVCQNKQLKALLEQCNMIFEKPLTISQVCFDKKEAVENHILMIGDTAGLIHPLCGNGMAMAIHSAKIASELIFLYFAGTIKSREELERRYKREWQRQFSRRLKTGRFLSMALRNRLLTKKVLQAISIFPSLLPRIIKQTHGKPIQLAS